MNSECFMTFLQQMNRLHSVFWICRSVYLICSWTAISFWCLLTSRGPSTPCLIYNRLKNQNYSYQTSHEDPLNFSSECHVRVLVYELGHLFGAQADFTYLLLWLLSQDCVPETMKSLLNAKYRCTDLYIDHN